MGVTSSVIVSKSLIVCQILPPNGVTLLGLLTNKTCLQTQTVKEKKKILRYSRGNLVAGPHAKAKSINAYILTAYELDTASNHESISKHSSGRLSPLRRKQFLRWQVAKI